MANIFNDARTTLAEVVLVANGTDPLTDVETNYVFVEFEDEQGRKARGHDTFAFGKTCDLAPGDEVSIAYVPKKTLDAPGAEVLEEMAEPLMEASVGMLKGVLGGLGAKAARRSLENAERERVEAKRRYVTYNVMILNLDRYVH